MSSKFDDPFWIHGARRLAELFACIPDLKDSDLGDDPQRFLAAYVPAPGSWDERTERLRSSFVEMEEKPFRGIYDTYLEERGKPGFNIRS